MAFPLIPLIGAIGGLLERLIPDPQARQAAQLKLFELQQAGELKELETATQLALAQIEVNKIEAASDSLFKSGWRPSVGWIATGGLAYQFLVQPLVAWASINQGWQAPPSLDVSTLLTLLFGLLGLGAYRTYERVKGGGTTDATVAASRAMTSRPIEVVSDRGH